jgi:NAD(P)-dependent dehydrogenase (short-subunit alcohol dehydrogenase family)
MGALSGKVAIVTGAGRGIGRGIALALAGEGAAVVAASRSQASVEAVTREISTGGGQALGVTVDVGERAAVFATVERAVNEFGRLDVLFNNAQGFGPASQPTAAPITQPLESYDEDEWEHTLRTGLNGTLWAMKAAFPHMKDRGGRIINFASPNGLLAYEGTAGYNCTKEAIRALTRTAAREWGKYGILVNTITPMVRTEASMSMSAAIPSCSSRCVCSLRFAGSVIR